MVFATDKTTVEELSEMVQKILSEPEEEDGYGFDLDEVEPVVRKLLLNPEDFAEFLYNYHPDFQETT